MVPALARTPFWPDSIEAGDAVLGACVAQLERWGVTRQYADGTLPVPGVYGVPEQWPHVRAAYERAGFVHQRRTEIVYVANVDELPSPNRPPVEGIALRRSVGINGTRLSAVLGDEVAGYIEVETLEDAGRLPRHGGWADIGNLHFAEPFRRRGVATWLLGQAAEWLRLARADRVLDYARPEEEDCAAFMSASGFRELTRTQRGWLRTAPHADAKR